MTDMAQLEPLAIEPPLRVIEVALAVGAKVPPQVLVAPGVPATTRPLGKLSTTPTPVRAMVLEAGLVIAMVRTELVLTGTLVGAKALVMVGGATTTKVAEAVVPVPPLVELTVPVVLTLLPAVDGVTVAVTVQVPLAAMDAPLRTIDVVVEVATEPPVQLVATPVCVMPEGKPSVKPTPVTVVEVLGLVSVIVKPEVPPSAIVAGLKALAMVGGAVPPLKVTMAAAQSSMSPVGAQDPVAVKAPVALTIWNSGYVPHSLLAALLVKAV